MQRTVGYTRLQIILHWTTALLVLLQFVFHDGMTEAFDAALDTGQRTFTTGAVLHIVSGTLILGLAIWRLSLRRDRPPPPPPEGEPSWAGLLAPIVHWTFYALLIALPVTGALAWAQESETWGDLHEALRAALLFLILAHVGAVILHEAVWKTGLISRMTRPGG